MDFKAATSNAKQTSTTIELTPDPVTVDGDMMLAVVVVRGPDVTPNPITPPAGWTPVDTIFESGSPSLNVGAYRRTAAGEGAAYAWTFTTANESTAALLVYGDVDPDAPVLVSAIGGQAAGSTVRTTPTIDVTEAECWVLSYYADRNGSTWVGPDVERAEVKVLPGPSASQLVCDSGGAVPIGETSRTATASASTSVAVQGIIALRPAPPPPEPPPAFPDVALKVDVELQIGETWERITRDVLTSEGITIERGRADEASEVTPSKMSLTLRNTAGKYSPRNPRSPYYGLIGRNTPIRVSVDHPDLPPAATYAYMPGIEANYIATPDTAALDLTGYLDIRMEITPDSWRPGVLTILASKMDWSTGNESWTFMLNVDGTLWFRWTDTGASSANHNSLSPLPVPAESGRLAVRCVFNGNDPANGNVRTYAFYTATSIAGPWSPLGAVDVGPAPGAIYAGTAALEIGTGMGGTRGFSTARPFHGRVHDLQLADAAGTVVADPGISAGPAVAGSEWDGPDGLLWTAYGSARIITGGPGNRFMGEVSAWPPHWSLGGHHQTVPIEASGVKRRLGQGSAPVQSPLRRTMPATPGIVQYWPMENAGGNFASAYAYGPLLRVTAGAATIAYAADSEFPGSAPIPVLGSGQAVAAIPAYPAGDSHDVLMLMHMSSPPSEARRILGITTSGSIRRWDLWYNPSASSLAITAYDRDGNKAIPETTANVPADGIVQQFAVRLEQQPTEAWMTVVGLELGSDTTRQWTSVAGGHTIGRITAITVGDTRGLGDTAIGHVAISTSVFAGLNAFRPQVLGYPGETAAARLARLAAENLLPLQIVGEVADTAPMGPQRVDTLLALLEECAAADGGILGEARDELGLLYRTRASLYNQTPALALSYGAPGLAAPFEPTDDDQSVRNHISVTRVDGSSALAVREDGPLSTANPPAGVGVYDDSITVNIATDEQLGDVAGWALHLGTWDESRYPSLGVKLHKAPGFIPAAARMDFGDRATVDNLPVWLPPGPADALIQGYVEVLELLRWRIDCNATPAGPWTVATVDGAHAAAGGSALAAAMDATATALAARPTAGPFWDRARPELFWTADPTDVPFAVTVAGEEMTVTAVAVPGDEVADSFSVTAADGWGSADTGQPWTVAAGAAADFSAASSTGGVITSGTVGVERGIVVDAGTPHQHVLAHSNTPVIPTGAPITWGFYLRYADPGSYYWVGVEIGTDSTLTLRIRKRVAGVLSLLASAPSATAHALSPWRILRAEAVGSQLRAKVWAAGSLEPDWEIDAVDADLTAGNSLGCVVRRETGSTNGTTTAFDLLDATPQAQTLTVVRSVNGISKPHVIGEGVELARPAYIAR